MANNKDYFEKQKVHSRIKSEMVVAYLPAWAKIISKHRNMLYYFDIFSGQGYFDDGNKSTPLMIMDILEENPWMKKILQINFYEGDKLYYQNLKNAIEQHVSYKSLSFVPKFNHEIINTNFVSKIREEIKVGSFTFIDPFGFKDISIELLDTVGNNWGCDCLFYLSISGLTRNYQDENQKDSVINFFGKDNIQILEKIVTEKLTNEEYEKLSDILFDETVNILKRKNDYKVIRFRIEFDDKERDSHYLVFLSKSIRGFKIMRDIMISRSVKDTNGMPLMVHSKIKKVKANQLDLIFDITTPRLENLCEQLIVDFKGRKILVEELFTKCLELSYPYSDAHVRKALKRLFKTHKLVIVNNTKNTNITNKTMIKIKS